MQVEIRIITSDYELGIYLLEKRRFPSRWQTMVPGKAIISSQDLQAGDELPGCPDIMDLVVDIDEDTSVDQFANWLHGKLNARSESIQSLIIAGVDTKVDEGEILRAIEEGMKEKAISHN